MLERSDTVKLNKLKSNMIYQPKKLEINQKVFGEIFKKWSPNK